MPLPGASTIHSPSSIALARTTSSSARQEGDPADLPEVHADRVVDPDHVGREGLELLGGRLRELLTSSLASSRSALWRPALPAARATSRSCSSRGSSVIVVLRRIGRGDASGPTLDGISTVGPSATNREQTSLYGIPSKQDIQQKAGGRLRHGRRLNCALDCGQPRLDVAGPIVGPHVHVPLRNPLRPSSFLGIQECQVGFSAAHLSPGLVRGEAGAVVLRPRSVRGSVIDASPSDDALPELDRGPLVEEAHRQGHPSPMLHRARR